METLDFNLFYDENYYRSFYFVKSYVHDDVVAEDIVVESLAKCWEVSSFEKSEISASYLFTILKNKSLNHLKQELVRQRSYASFCEWNERELSIRLSSLNDCDPKEIFSSEIQSIITKALSTMPEQTRRIFEMSRFEDISVKNIALKMGMSSKGVEYHITRSLKILRIALKDYLPIFYAFFIK